MIEMLLFTRAAQSLITSRHFLESEKQLNFGCSRSCPVTRYFWRLHHVYELLSSISRLRNCYINSCHCFGQTSAVHFNISHQSIQTGVTVWKRQIRVKMGDNSSCVTLTFDRWHWKTIRHLFYATSSFVHHFTAINQFKLELQSGNAKFG